MTANQLVKELYDSGGFTAKKVADGVGILEEMVQQKDCVEVPVVSRLYRLNRDPRSHQGVTTEKTL
jgi:deoxyhypusine synthase